MTMQNHPRDASSIASAARDSAAPATPRRAEPVRPQRSPGCSSRRRSLLLLAINIFPLIWTIRLSFTNYQVQPRPNVPIKCVGLDNYVDILTDPDIWHAMQVTAHFVVLVDRARKCVLGFGLALLINRKFRGHSFWTTVILLPMMLSPAVVGNFWTLPVPAADRACSTTSSAFSPASRRAPSR